MWNRCLLFCDVDQDGRIVESLIGERVVPMRQYQHFFFLMEDPETVNQNISNYLIIDGQLTLES
jgi:hypothetical protein